MEVVATVSSNPPHNWAHTLVQPSALNGQQRKQVEQLLKEFNSVFSRSPSDYGKTELTERQIDKGVTCLDSHPEEFPPRHLQVDVDKQIDSMLDNGIIEPSRSPCSSPIVLPKKDGGIRFCVKYRRLNSENHQRCLPIATDIGHIGIAGMSKILFYSGPRLWIPASGNAP